MKYFYPFLFCILFPAFSFAQTSGISLQVKTGLIGDSQNQTPTYSSFETSHSAEPGLIWSAGAAYQHFFNQHVGFRAGILYEQAQFTRVEEYQFQTFQNIDRSGNINRRFSNQSLLVPLQLLWQYKRVGLSTGAICNIHLGTKAEIEHIFFEREMEIDRVKATYKSGEYKETGPNTGFGEWEQTDLERKIDFQWVVGVYVQMTRKITLDLEYKNFFSKNLLIREVQQNDVVGTYKESYDPFAGSISLGLNWVIAD